MTRPSFVLRDKLVNLHHQSVSTILLRQSGNSTPPYQINGDLKIPAHPLALNHSSPRENRLQVHRRQGSYHSRPFSKYPIRFGARSVSHSGNILLQSPSQHSRPRCLKQELHITSDLLLNPKQSSSSSWTTVIIVAIISGAVLYSVSPKDIGSLSEREQGPADVLIDFTPGQTGTPNNMTGEALPGRPGMLTPQEDERLKDFWVATLQVFGVLDPKELNGNGDATRERSSTAFSKDAKPKKKRLSLFRKHKDDDTESVTSTDSGTRTSSGDSDDKYGQTKEFHDALANLTPEALRAAFWSMVKHDHPDALLLRFLRARKWDVEKALVMMVSTMRWRSKDMHVDDEIMKKGELVALEDSQASDPAKKRLGKDFLAQMRMGKSFIHGLDKEGRPMCFVRVRLHKQGEQSEESLERYTVFLIESARMVLNPPIDTACIVFDMTGFSMANMDYAPVKFMIKCFEANYPESLGVVLIHKAPWIFQGIWKIIKGWLDPVVASKVHFTNNNEEMEHYVPKSNIIKELHGDDDWNYKYIEPVSGENDIMNDTETRDKYLTERKAIVEDYEKLTLEWIRGTEDAATVKMKRNKLANALRDDYWRLDPYIRAKSYYDRVGMIQPSGKLQFYPGKTIAPTPEATKTEAPAPTPAALTNGAQPHVHSADDVD